MRNRTVLRTTTRFATVLVTIGAWLLLSNHCALGLGAAANSASEPGGCPMHSAPAKEKPVPNLHCCKDLHAVAPHAVKNLAAVATQSVRVQEYLAAAFLTPRRLTAQLLFLETGPPRTLSFAESILQRSILAHAPPAGLLRR